MKIKLLIALLIILATSARAQIINTIAGNGIFTYYSDGGLADTSAIGNTAGLTLDKSGNIYFSDGSNYRVRKITVATGIISTVAGTGVKGSLGDGGPADSA